MNTPNFEVQFITRLRDHIVSKYPELSFSVSRTPQQPDVVIENTRTGTALGVEVKGGNSANPVPPATIAVLIELSAAMKDRYPHSRRIELWVVSTGKVLPPWADILANEQIRVINADSVDDALGKLDSRLRALAAGD